ncbi:MAG: hypothetical protein HZB13_19340 [Acidobacteria bacterium]|nr:hypothetical protein [Acidobacteriota bacterium]
MHPDFQSRLAGRPPPPDPVLQQAQEVQARGDVDATFSLVAPALFAENNAATVSQAFSVLREISFQRTFPWR